MDSDLSRPFHLSALATSAGIVVSFVIVVLGVVALLWPYEPVVVGIGDTDPGPHAPGDTLRIDVEYCNPGFTVTTVLWLDSHTPDGVVVSSQNLSTRHFFPVAAVNKGCHDLSAKVNLPGDLSPGVYALRAESSWRPNPIRADNLTSATDLFRVEELT